MGHDGLWDVVIALYMVVTLYVVVSLHVVVLLYVVVSLYIMVSIYMVVSLGKFVATLYMVISPCGDFPKCGGHTLYGSLHVHSLLTVDCGHTLWWSPCTW